MKKFKLVSLDTSTKKSGVALFENGVLTDYRLFDYSKVKDVEQRIDMMGGQLWEYLEEVMPDVIYIESPQGHGKNVYMIGKLSEIMGMVRAYAVIHRCDYNELTPSEWRKNAGFAQGKKKRDELKAMSIKYVKDNYSIDVEDDVADAISIGCSVINFFNAFASFE